MTVEKKRLSFEIDPEVKDYLDTHLPHGALTELGRIWTQQLVELLEEHGIRAVVTAAFYERLNLRLEELENE